MGEELLYLGLDEHVAGTEGLEALDSEVASRTAALSTTSVDPDLVVRFTVGREMGVREFNKSM
jgi:hypothetical protein